MSSYATVADFDVYGLPTGWLKGTPIDAQKALDAASSVADSYLGAKYTLPLSPLPGGGFDPALTMAVCQIAAWHLMARRGFNPSNSSDPVIRQGYEDARAWLLRVANGQAVVQVVQAQPPSLQPDLSSNQPRGYGDLIGNGATDYPGVGNSGWGV